MEPKVYDAEFVEPEPAEAPKKGRKSVLGRHRPKVDDAIANTHKVAGGLAKLTPEGAEAIRGLAEQAQGYVDTAEAVGEGLSGLAKALQALTGDSLKIPRTVVTRRR